MKFKKKYRPRLSIGIPTFNQGDTIEETILSILNQTEPVYEIVVSENHCTDNTNEILDKYKDKIKIVRPEKFLSMVENWNFLLNNLSGDWFFLISSDDVMLPNYAQTFYDNVRKDTVLMRYGFNRIDGNSIITQKDVRIKSARTITRFPANFNEELSCPKMSFGAYTIKLDTFKLIGFFDQRAILDSDWATWLRLSPLGKFHYIPITVTNYRLAERPGFSEKRLWRETLDQVAIQTEIIPEIVSKYNIHPWFLNKAKISVAKRRYNLHKSMNDPQAERVLLLFGVTVKDIKTFSRLDNFMLQFNEHFAKF